MYEWPRSWMLDRIRPIPKTPFQDQSFRQLNKLISHSTKALINKPTKTKLIGFWILQNYLRFSIINAYAYTFWPQSPVIVQCYMQITCYSLNGEHSRTLTMKISHSWNVNIRYESGWGCDNMDYNESGFWHKRWLKLIPNMIIVRASDTN